MPKLTELSKESQENLEEKKNVSKLTEVSASEEALIEQSMVQHKDEVEDEENYLTESDNESDLDDDILNESVLDRISALRDIISPKTRFACVKGVKRFYGLAVQSAKMAGSGLWIVSTAATILFLPLALEVEKESAAINQESQMLLQQQQAQAMVEGGKPAAEQK